MTADRASALEYAKLLEEQARRKRYCAMDFYEAQPKHTEFFALTRDKHQVAFIAGNRTGKSWAAGYATACHLTGRYASWWPGKRFSEPTHWWSAGPTGQTVRDTNQRILFGYPQDELGTGFIPKKSILETKTAHGYADLYDFARIRHVSGGVSTVKFMTYEMGRIKFQAATLHGICNDEEPPEDIYNEEIVRVATTGGIVISAFTPLLGMTGVVAKYMEEPDPDRAWVGMALDEAQHIPRDERARIFASYAEHEREARAKGVPMLGSGRIFAVSEAQITEPAMQIVPPFWAFGIGMDYGIDHPFGAVLMAWDREADCVHVLDCKKLKGATVLEHAAALKPWGPVKVFWPHDVAKRDGAGGGETYARIYRNAGLKMHGSHATWKDGGISTEAAVLECQERFRSGRLKIASHLEELLAEIRIYHRKDGQIVKLKDDLISAMFKGIMMLRHFQPRENAGTVGYAGPQATPMCRDINFDVFDIAA